MAHDTLFPPGDTLQSITLYRGHWLYADLQYEESSAPALALKATIERTEKRFANYGSAGLLCGTDGLPHLISDPGLALRFGHAGETLVRPARSKSSDHSIL